MDHYALIKSVHIACAAISISGFVVRGVWMLTGSALLTHHLTRLLPHLVDSGLLLSALWLVITSEQYPSGRDWLTVKLVAVVLYVLVGTVALKRGRTARVRSLAFMIAVGMFGYIVAVALTRQPWPLT